MPERKGFDLGEYVEVKDRIRVLFELFPQARIVTEPPLLTSEPDGKARVICRALVYRTPEDPFPSTGTSWLELPGTTPYTRGSEAENAETSAVGRAIGFLGILIDRSIASSNEIEAKRNDGPQTPEPAPEPRDGSLIGFAEVAKPPHDFELRMGPDGYSLGFGLKEGRQIVRVMAKGDLAEALSLIQGDVVGKRVTCYGLVTPDSWTMKAGTAQERVVPYLRLALSKIDTPTVTLPAPDAEIDALPMFSEEPAA